MQSLNPIFPCDFGDENSYFWAWNFDVLTSENANILVLNSSAHHGINDEFLHGRVSEITIKKALEKIKKTEKKKINILLCHHHIQKQEDLDIQEYDAMHGAERLLTGLTENDEYDWLIIHGHKHYPKIYYGSTGTGSSIPIISAGSFSGDITGKLQSRVSNQFYIIDIYEQYTESLGIVGQITAWDWAHGRGWVKASLNSGLPHKAGFGHQFHKRNVIRDLSKLQEDYYEKDM